VGHEVAGIVYNKRGERLDLFIPGGDAPAGGWPVVLAFEGAGWRRAGREPYGEIVAGALARFGFAVASADYAGASPGFSSWPADLTDAQDAVRWLRSNAPRISLDPNRIVALGESAGGNLAALLGTVSAETTAASVSDTVQAVVDFYGPTNLTALDQESAHSRQFVVPYLGGTPSQIPDRYSAASPLDHVATGDPPTLIFHGENDKGVPPDQSVEFAAALRNAGVPNTLILIPGAAHGFHFRAGGEDLAPEVAAFLDANLGLDGPASPGPAWRRLLQSLVVGLARAARPSSDLIPEREC
jgi:acetyl esterase/lipase